MSQWIFNTQEKSEKIREPFRREKLMLYHDYYAFCNKFIDMLTQFGSLWVRHVGSLKAEKYQVEPVMI